MPAVALFSRQEEAISGVDLGEAADTLLRLFHLLATILGPSASTAHRQMADGGPAKPCAHQPTSRPPRAFLAEEAPSGPEEAWCLMGEVETTHGPEEALKVD